jgi:hypothetical protein
MHPLRHFTDHPATVGESYLEHMQSALCFGFRLLGAGCACLIHAFLPFLCVKTGSRAIAELNDRMIANRCARSPQTQASHSRLST